MKKILVIRFSAMGDVVLTSPVLRCIKQAYPHCELHVVVKQKFRDAVMHNAYVNQVHTFNQHPREIAATLENEHFDFVADLQCNRKSSWLRRQLGTAGATFPKLNLRKFLLTTFKINTLPKIHVVDRYFKAVEKINVQNDHKGLDFFLLPEKDLFDAGTRAFFKTPYIALVLGATYYTKRIPPQKLEEIITAIGQNVVLLGGPGEKEMADALAQKFPWVKNTVGHCSLQQSAYYIQYAHTVITPDTGLMHIAAALHKRVITVWGNTVPGFGMYAYMPQEPAKALSFEVKDLPCRPCSKLGYQACPKKHFKCMLGHDSQAIASVAKEGL